MSIEKTAVEVKIPSIEFLEPESGVDFHWWHKNKTPLHSHSYYEIVVIAKGSVGHICNDSKYVMDKYDVVLLRPGDVHMFLASHTASQLNFSIVKEEFVTLCDLISPSLYDNINADAPKKISVTDVELEYYLLLVNQISLQNRKSDKLLNASLIKCVIINILLSFNRFLEIQASTSNALPEWLVSFLDNISSPDVFVLPLKQIYCLAPYSQTMLNLYFNKYVGETPVAHIKKLKMDYATHLLTHSDFTISQIAAKMSYSPSHFIHEFNKEYGLSPAKYRDKLNKF